MNVTALRMEYIGACCLLGRMSKYVTDKDDLDCIRRALEDCAKYSDGRLEVIPIGPQGFALEPVRSTSIRGVE